MISLNHLLNLCRITSCVTRQRIQILVSLDSAIHRWKLGHVDAVPSMEEYDAIVEQWKAKDMVAKFLGIYSSRRFYSDWISADPADESRKRATWAIFKAKMQEYYKPTENLTLKNFQFRSLSQGKEESFVAFCNSVAKEARHCQFKCGSADCSAESTAIRDQVVIGIVSDEIRQEALKNSWSLVDLRKEGMRLESAAKGASEISGEHNVNKVGKYSFKNTKKKDAGRVEKKASCYTCGLAGSRNDIISHAKTCPAKLAVCSNCMISGHYAKVCQRKGSSVNGVQSEVKEPGAEEIVYNVNIFRVCASAKVPTAGDFKAQMLINNCLDTVLADTGAGVSVCGVNTARKWNVLDRMSKTSVQIKPYGSSAIPAVGVSTCGVSFGDRTVPVQWYIIDDSCEPILQGLRRSTRVVGAPRRYPEPESSGVPGNRNHLP